MFGLTEARVREPLEVNVSETNQQKRDAGTNLDTDGVSNLEVGGCVITYQHITFSAKDCSDLI